MSSRNSILANIRRNLPTPPRDRPDVPWFDDAPHPPLLDWFRDSLVRMGGVFLEPPAGGDPLDALAPRLAAAAVVCSAVPEVAGNRVWSATSDMRDIDDVDIAVVRAGFAVAETGSVFFSERELPVNALVYLAQHLIVLLDPADLVSNLHRAYARPEFQTALYGVFHTGPSATADIEGVLIHGAQGVRSLSVLIVSRSGEST